MCGIFGYSYNEKLIIEPRISKKIIKGLFKLSESRGKEASGFASLDNRVINVYKTPYAASYLIKTKEFQNYINNTCNFNNTNHTTKDFGCIIGHSRLVTDGFEQNSENNQPVIKNNIIGIHNGIVVNVNELWKKFNDEKRTAQIDSELILTLLRKFYNEEKSLNVALGKTYNEIYGMASVAFMFSDLNNLLLATNNGSLYYLSSFDKNSLLFASERYILETLIIKNKLNEYFNSNEIIHLKPYKACLINLKTIEIDEINFKTNNKEFNNISHCKPNNKINNLSDNIKFNTNNLNIRNQDFELYVPSLFIKHFLKIKQKINSLKKCSKCLLPVTFPFIEFDEDGVCNYCKNYQKISLKGKNFLEKDLEPYRRKDGNPNCLVTFSGGRDSSYGLHYLKKEMNINPIAYSYDWGMITDLARRNQSRLCGKLGIEHILVSADIRKKRANIRKNVLAWLKRPNLGTVTLFMAGDKQYFYYANKLAKQNHLDLIVLCSNLLEVTNFKNGFCGIAPSFKETSGYKISYLNKLKLFSFFGQEYLLNPRFLNPSVFDTLGAYLSYYVISHDYLNIYNYIKWDEKTINSTLKNEYDWEVAEDTETTWRIGDGTAPFYNYIYYVMAGFTENDTFRSNQIREGIISREEALKLVKNENQPRWDSIKWYCQTINIDFENTIRVINSAPTLY